VQEVAEVMELLHLDNLSGLAEQQPALLDREGVQESLRKVKEVASSLQQILKRKSKCFQR
jgi:hypothetical protein